MISAVDTNVLLDVFLPDKRFGERSARLLKLAYDEGALIICEIVYAELVPQFSDGRTLDDTLAALNISVSFSSPDVALLAGERWGQYRKTGGTRKRIITDFLIGAHATIKAERFLTRDRGFYKSYFPELVILS
ncbi:MAG TPA: type II toxin-antitoxin system VapC family toxin [Desulfatiglandales bacterium]|nr:type II toxin-antitoxin system VapC family toxin [Desulfatiglandales bacterium]